MVAEPIAELINLYHTVDQNTFTSKTSSLPGYGHNGLRRVRALPLLLLLLLLLTHLTQTIN